MATLVLLFAKESVKKEILKQNMQSFQKVSFFNDIFLHSAQNEFAVSVRKKIMYVLFDIFEPNYVLFKYKKQLLRDMKQIKHKH